MCTCNIGQITNDVTSEHTLEITTTPTRKSVLTDTTRCGTKCALLHGCVARFNHKVTRTIPRGKDIPELPVRLPKTNLQQQKQQK